MPPTSRGLPSPPGARARGSRRLPSDADAAAAAVALARSRPSLPLLPPRSRRLLLRRRCRRRRRRAATRGSRSRSGGTARPRRVLDACDLERVRHLLEREVVALEVDVDVPGQARLRLERRVGLLVRRADELQDGLGRVLVLPLRVVAAATALEAPVRPPRVALRLPLLLRLAFARVLVLVAVVELRRAEPAAERVSGLEVVEDLRRDPAVRDDDAVDAHHHHRREQLLTARGELRPGRRHELLLDGVVVEAPDRAALDGQRLDLLERLLLVDAVAQADARLLVAVLARVDVDHERVREAVDEVVHALRVGRALGPELRHLRRARGVLEGERIRIRARRRARLRRTPGLGLRERADDANGVVGDLLLCLRRQLLEALALVEELRDLLARGGERLGADVRNAAGRRGCRRRAHHDTAAIAGTSATRRWTSNSTGRRYRLTRGGVRGLVRMLNTEKLPGQSFDSGVNARSQRASARSSRGRSESPNATRSRNVGGTSGSIPSNASSLSSGPSGASSNQRSASLPKTGPTSRRISRVASSRRATGDGPGPSGSIVKRSA